ncbi:MAG: tRNA lysidine(34) synthetase TilS [Clostridiales bacterium]|jgi:tRNA(Ile)-lysidine synthase|nr:tRNA lysidine(34) synthetase TilS [Clostridiales bacterium]
MIPSVLAAIQKHEMLSKGDYVLLGLSGGADSVCLFHLLLELREEYKLRLKTIHINHKMRGEESESDMHFCKELSERHGVEAAIFEFDAKALARRQKLTVEEAARNYRYKIFSEAAASVNADKVALAHSMNDNAETLVLRICRGTGIKGLCGIPPVRDQIIRPLICTSRPAIEAYLKELGEPFRTDSSNLTDDYARNRARRHVIPAMEDALGPGVVKSLARTCELAMEENSYLEEEAQAAYKKCLAGEWENETTLDAQALMDLHPAMSSRVIRMALSRWSLRDVSREHVQMVKSLLGGTGKSVSLPGGLEGRVDYGKLTISQSRLETASFSRELSLGSFAPVPELGLSFSLEDTMGGARDGFSLVRWKAFSKKKVGGKIQIRSRLSGDKIRMQGVGTVKLKDYFINAKVDRRDRDRAGLAAIGGDVLWIMDSKGAAHQDYEAAVGEEAVYLKAWRKR